MEIILGAAVSLLVQLIKKVGGTTEYVTLGAVLVLSIIAAALHYYFSDTTFWQDWVQILAYSGGIYAYLIKRFE